MANQDTAEQAERSLKKAISDTNEVLVSASTALTLSPIIVTLNRSKLVVEKRSLLRVTGNIKSERIEDVSDVNATIGPVFGTITIITKLADPKTDDSLGLFWRKDTIKLKRVIQGYLIALQKGINLDTLPIEKLLDLIYELGTDDHSIK